MAVDLALADHLLSTTRSVRKRLDLLRPVEPAVIERAIEVAFQAPTGSNSQGWHFLADPRYNNPQPGQPRTWPVHEPPDP